MNDSVTILPYHLLQSNLAQCPHVCVDLCQHRHFRQPRYTLVCALCSVHCVCFYIILHTIDTLSYLIHILAYTYTPCTARYVPSMSRPVDTCWTIQRINVINHSIHNSFPHTCKCIAYVTGNQLWHSETFPTNPYSVTSFWFHPHHSHPRPSAPTAYLPREVIDIAPYSQGKYHYRSVDRAWIDAVEIAGCDLAGTMCSLRRWSSHTPGYRRGRQ